MASQALGSKRQRSVLAQAPTATSFTSSSKILCVLTLGRVESTTDGRIQDTSGEVIYRVFFKALVMKPFKGEVLDGVVMDVSDNGIMI